MAFGWWSEDNFVGSILSFLLYEGLWDQTQVVKLMITDDIVVETSSPCVAQANLQSVGYVCATTPG